MDNLTHSLTGVMVTRLYRAEQDASTDAAAGPSGRKPRTGRTLFWLILFSVNLPDIDIVANFFTDPLNALHYHRGFTHSFLMAPLLALFPTMVVRIFDRRARFTWLWIAAMIGIVLHIFIDLITPYGTQIFFPLSEARYSLDWMFIIDPWFTGVLALLLIAGKVAAKYRREIGVTTLAFAAIYIGAESRLHSRAMELFTRQLRDAGTPALAVAVLPQPLSMMEWVGLAETKAGPVRQYIRLFDQAGIVAPESFPLPTDRHLRMAYATPYVSSYLKFARFPAVTSSQEGGLHRVEFRDLQFSVDPGIVKAVGLGERDIPFVLRLEYDPSDSLVAVTFNGRPVPRE
jgi:inner membrane protein